MTNHCVVAEGGVDAKPPSDAQPGDVAPPNDAGATLLFDEEFDAGLDNQKWVPTGDGTWSISGGFGEQSNGNAQETLMYAAKFTTATDYHIVARMHSTGPFNANHDLAPEICFRTDPSVYTVGIPETYHCNFDLQANNLQIDKTEPNVANSVAITNLTLPNNFDAGTWFVIDAVVQGTNVVCTLTIDGLGQVGSVSYNNVARGVGSFGLKTYETSAEFAYFRAYSVP